MPTGAQPLRQPRTGYRLRRAARRLLEMWIMKTRAAATIRAAVLGVALAAGCGPSGTPAPALSPHRPAMHVQTDPADHMRDHFHQIIQIRDGLIAGDLHSMKQPAAWLAQHGGPMNGPVSWKPYRAELRRLGSEVLGTSDLPDAARDTARMAAVCGLCHRSAGAPVALFMPALVEQAGDLTSNRMKRHKWAIDRLWDGLVAPSDTAWRVGAEVLLDAPLVPGDVAADGPIEPGLAQRIGRVHRLAGAARGARQPGERAALMGELLGTCAGCHRALHVRR